jgi:hypothetical protein
MTTSTNRRLIYRPASHSLRLAAMQKMSISVSGGLWLIAMVVPDPIVRPFQTPAMRPTCRNGIRCCQPPDSQNTALRFSLGFILTPSVLIWINARPRNLAESFNLHSQ